MLENAYQAKLIKKLRKMYPDCVVLKNDANYMSGVPDLIVLIGPCWFMLETKSARLSRQQPNQAWYVNKLNEMSFAAFIFPENEDEVLDAILQTLRSRG